MITETTPVHYVAYNGRHLAAFVIGVGAYETCDLALFTNLRNIAGTVNFGLQFHADIPHSEGKEPGTWHHVEVAPGEASK